MCINFNYIFSGFVDKNNVEDYQLLREKFANKCRNNSNFKRAVDEMDRFISDPEKFKSNAVARVVKIKTEADIEKHLGIKVERKNSIDSIPGKSSVASNEADLLRAEKVNLITEIDLLKSENQYVNFQLNEHKNELTAVKLKYDQNVQKFNREIAKISLGLKTAESEIQKLKKEHLEEKAIDKKLIDKLDSEKKILSARVKQIQSCTHLNVSSNGEHTIDKNDGAENEYEVDKLIADERVGKTRYYLVRWKGYGREDDTWEKEQNLSCPTILEEYNKRK